MAELRASMYSYYYKSQMLQTNLLSTAANLKGEEEKVEGKGEEEA